MTDWRAERDNALLALERETREGVRADAAGVLCDLAFDVPAELKTEFAPAVVKLVNDESAEVRCAGLALALEVLPVEESKTLLKNHVTDKTPRVRMEAVGRLADLALPETRGIFAAALTDSSAGVQFEGARGMAAIKHPAGLEVLKEALNDAELRFRAAAALAQLGDSAAVPALKKVFDGWFVPAFDRTQIAGALAALGDEAGLAHLLKRAAKKWVADRAMAVEMLGETHASAAKSRLLEILADPQDWCRGAAARGLGRLGDSSAEPAMVQALESGKGDDERLDVAEGLWRLGTVSAKARVSALQLDSPEARAEHAELVKS